MSEVRRRRVPHTAPKAHESFGQWWGVATSSACFLIEIAAL